MPKLYEDDIRRAGIDPAKARAEAEAEGIEWVPSAVAQPAQSANFGLASQPLGEATGYPRPISPTPSPQVEAENRQGLRLAGGLGLPMMFTGPGVAGAAIGGAIGTGLSELGDYTMSQASGHPEEAPSFGGASLRTAAQLAIPYGLGKFSEAVAPLAQKAMPTLSKLPKIATETLGKVGSGIKTITSKTLGETTAAKTAKDALLRDLEGKIPDLPVDEFISRIQEKFLPFAKEEMAGLVDELQKAAGSSGKISLINFQELVRAARQSTHSPAARQAFKAFNDEFKESVANHIASNPNGGPVLAQEFLDLTEETWQRLHIAEQVQKQIGTKGAVGVAQRFITDEPARRALKALDEITGNTYTQQIEALAREAAVIEKRAGEVAATNASNAQLLALQKRARSVLYGILGTIGGSGFRTITGGAGGLLGGEIMSALVNRFVGEALPIERAIASAIGAASKASPYIVPPATEAIQAMEEPNP